MTLCNAVYTGWSERFPDNSLFQPTEQVNKLVEAGKIGTKSGECAGIKLYVLFVRN